MSNAGRYWDDQHFIYKLVQQIPSSVFWKDTEGRYLGCNDLFAHSLGLPSADAVIGKTDYDLPVKKEDSDAYRADDQYVMQTKESKLNIEETQIFEDGKQLILLTSKVPLFDQQNNVIGVLGVYSDITDIKRTQEELREAKEKADKANELRMKILTTVRQEIPKHLTKILEKISILKTNIHIGRNQYEVEAVVDETTIVKKLVDDIIAFTEGETVKQYLYPFCVFDFNEFLSGIVAENCLHAEKKGVLVSLDFSNEAPNIIRSDPYSLRKIFHYLISYAVEKSPRKNIVLHVVKVIEGSKNNDNKLLLDIIIKSEGERHDVEPSVISLSNEADKQNVSLSDLFGILPIEQLIRLLNAEVVVASEDPEEFEIKCRFSFEYNRSAAINRHAWVTYQTTTRILIIDNQSRGRVIACHLGQTNIDVISDPDETDCVLRAAMVLKKPYHIVMIGQAQRGGQKDDFAPRLARDISKQKDIQQPMVVLIAPLDAADVREWAEQQYFYSVIQPMMPPIALQTHLTALWERWNEELEAAEDFHSFLVCLEDNHTKNVKDIITALVQKNTPLLDSRTYIYVAEGINKLSYYYINEGEILSTSTLTENTEKHVVGKFKLPILIYKLKNLAHPFVGYNLWKINQENVQMILASTGHRQEGT